jgi:hypothetical protein
MAKAVWRTTALRVISAFAVGALVGTAAYFVCSWWLGGPMDAPSTVPEEPGSEDMEATFRFAGRLAVLFGWATGLLVVAGPVWLALERHRLTAPAPFISAFTVAGLAAWALAVALLPPDFASLWLPSMSSGGIPFVAAAGGGGSLLAGMAMWRIAYRREVVRLQVGEASTTAV